MSTRQERRRAERAAKKNKQDGSYEMYIQFVQPWSCPILMTRLPDNILGKMLEITDEVIEKKEQSWGQNLAGQIENELVVPHEMLKEAGVFDFFHDLVRHFVIQCKLQQMGPGSEEKVHNEQWLVQMLSMWVVNQYENEYNPTHIHTQCQISSAMYLKVPKFVESRKKHRSQDDGSICFTGPASRDNELSNPTWSWRPQLETVLYLELNNYIMYILIGSNKEIQKEGVYLLMQYFLLKQNKINLNDNKENFKKKIK